MSDGITDARRGFESISLTASALATSASKSTCQSQVVKPSYVFRVKMESGRPFNGLKCNTDGEIYLITDNPSTIYERFKVDDIISVEKISHCYIL